MESLEELATQICHAFTCGGVISRSLSSEIHSVDDAYAVQNRVADLIDSRRIGWKVGATSKEPQQLLGTAEPATAPMFGSTYLQSPAKAAIFPNQDCSVEAEFAFRFIRTLPPRQLNYQMDEVLDSVDVLIPSIEIVGCRFQNGFANLGAIRLIADMTAHTAFVAGPNILEWRDLDLRSSRVSLYRNDKLIVTGMGANVLEGPLSVLEWTVNHLSRRGETLRQGEIVTTGTCTGITAVNPGDNIEAVFENLGSVELDLIPH